MLEQIPLIFTALNLVSAGVGNSGGGSNGVECYRWKTVVNTSYPAWTSQGEDIPFDQQYDDEDEIEPPPTQADIDKARNTYCPRENGTLRMRCAYYDGQGDLVGFYGILATDAIESHCSWSNGSFCYPISESYCPDHVIQLSCDCYDPNFTKNQVLDEIQICSNAAVDLPTRSPVLTSPAKSNIALVGLPTRSPAVTSDPQSGNCPQNGRQKENNAINVHIFLNVYLLCVILSAFILKC